MELNAHMIKCGKVLLVLTSSVLALLIMEIVVRVLDIPPRPLAPLAIPSYQLSANPVISYEYRPGYKSSDLPYPQHSGFAINRDGFRDYEYEEAKPEGTYRVVVLGDSTTAGNRVQDVDKTYTKQLEMLLNKGRNSDLHYEVLNMGVGGYHTMQEIETLRVKGLKYHPDLVLVTFCVNDFHMHSDGGVYDRLRKANHLSSLRNTGYQFYNDLLRVSRLAFILHHRLTSSQTAFDRWYAKDVLQGRSTVKAGLSLLSTLQQKYGFSAIVVILPEFRVPFSKYRLRNIHEKVFQAARGLPGITVIDLLKSFAAVDDDARKFAFSEFNDFIHLNEYGHKTVAEMLLPIVRTASLNASKSRPLR